MVHELRLRRQRRSRDARRTHRRRRRAGGRRRRRWRRCTRPTCPASTAVAEFLGVDPAQLLKCIAFDVDGELGLALVPGDREVNAYALDRPRSRRDRCGCSTTRTSTAHPELPKGYIGPHFPDVAVVVADPSVGAPIAWITGANEPDHHVRNAVLGRDFHVDVWADLVTIVSGDPARVAASPLSVDRGIEVGHVFQLGTKYSEALDARYTDERRRAAPDADGLLRHRHLAHRRGRRRGAPRRRTGSRGPRRSRRTTCTSSCCPGAGDAAADVVAAAERLYDELTARRRRRCCTTTATRSPGVKFADADLARHAGAARRRRRRARAWRRRAQGRATGDETSSPRATPSRPSWQDGAMTLPVTPPVVADAREARRASCPPATGWLVRAEVGRLPLHRVPRRRRDRARQPQRASRSPATSPSSSSRCSQQLPERVRGRRRDRRSRPSDGLDFDALQLRIHPAAVARERSWRPRPRRRSSPSTCSPLGDDDLREQPFRERRAAPRAVLAEAQAADPPHARDRRPAIAADWFERFEGAGLDGVDRQAARRRRTAPDKRAHAEGQAPAHRRLRGRRASACTRTARASARCCSASTTTTAMLHHVGVASSFAAPLRKQLADELEPLPQGRARRPPVAGVGRRRGAAAAAGSACRAARAAGTPSKDLSWEPLRIERVAEVAYEHLQGGRFRHTARFLRWRPDRDPSSCTYDQLEAPVPPSCRDLRP